ncbi:KxYKxGKxW signal peptide [Streptococcus urinalis FB127-CNA-2]|uniref:KxYKxGKxW signal domain protein n=1 Tax=Streptococcus urinalis 2285-97 TaxID=764291 RepID=G5KHS2_9STRE|nr:accessory Sec-dependent serine-rich glycoprotein adhesin [Streptococcus urinalis]EHJ55844.1 KxYKxGKxW signal domain protein [Streptococcus urinalis 2285-97]EKS21175.1 KxYKxGKxW signal peptide [Streptococcus urinalis FB127-CNA-2]VEF31184.1 cell wall surface anchor family protein [Streptococcus urinalis]
MKNKQFGTAVTVSDSSSRVKMHKSGKHWVRTLMSHFHILKNMRGSSEMLTKSHIVLDEKPETLSVRDLSVLKGLIAASTITGAAVVTTTAVEAEDTTNATLVNTDSVTISTTESTS